MEIGYEKAGAKIKQKITIWQVIKLPDGAGQVAYDSENKVIRVIPANEKIEVKVLRDGEIVW